MKSYYDKVQAEQSVGSWGDFVQKLKNIYRQQDNKEGVKKELMALWVNKDLAKKNFIKYAEQYRTLARIVNYSDEVHINKMKEVIPDKLQNVLLCQTAVQAIKVIFFIIIMKITSSREELSPPGMFLRCLVIDLSI